MEEQATENLLTSEQTGCFSDDISKTPSQSPAEEIQAHCELIDVRERLILSCIKD